VSLENLTPDELAFLNIGKLLMQNQEVSREAKRLLKKAKPDVSLPDIELEDRLAAREAEITRKQTEFEERLNKDALERKIEAQRQSIRDQGIDVTALEAFMKEHEIYSYEKAAKIFSQVNRPADPTPSSLMTEVKGMQGDDAKKLWGNPTEWARQTAKQALDELRGHRAA
jgi:hypothetical protein